MVKVKSRPVSIVQYDFYKRRMPELAAQFPHLFDKRFPEPLALGITQKLVKLTAFTEKEISALLYVWCGRHEYLMMCVSVGSRVDVDGSMELMSEVHRQSYYKRVNGLVPGRIRQWARDFEIMYQMKPFAFMPMDENPRLKEGWKDKPQPQWDAILSNVVVSGTWASGRIFGDKKTDGNHPFPDGRLIETSPVVKIYSMAGVEFLKTRNTLYRVFGKILKPTTMTVENA